MIYIILAVVVIANFLFISRILLIQHFKIAYYEQKLINRGVDISHIVNITLKEVIN